MSLPLLLARLLLVLALRVMPAHQARKHFEPPWRGDRLWGIQRVRRGRAVDTNYHLSADLTLWCGHWGIPEHDDWHYIVANGHVRRMTHAELHRPMHEWTDEQIRRWRRGPSIHSEAPVTYRQMAAAAVARGVFIYAELKCPISAEAARRMVADAHAVGHPPWFMAMLRQSQHAPVSICAEKCAHVVQAGGQFRVIYGHGRIGVRNRVIARRAIAAWHVKPTARG